MRRELFETPGEVTLGVSLASGRVDIETVEGTTTEVELDASGSDEAVQELLENSRIEVREAGGGYQVTVDVKRRKRFGFSFDDLDVRLAIRAPHGANLELAAASADTLGRGRFGSLDAKAASGDIEVEDVAGDAVANAASGDISVRSVGGSAKVNTASGDVQLGRVEGETAVKTASGDVTVADAGSGVKIATASGDQAVEAVAEGKVNLQSASGDIEVGIREGSNVWVDARAMSGELSSEVELGDAPPSGEDAPLVELRATSMSGDVTVRRAPAAPSKPRPSLGGALPARSISP